MWGWERAERRRKDGEGWDKEDQGREEYGMSGERERERERGRLGELGRTRNINHISFFFILEFVSSAVIYKLRDAIL